MIVVILSHLHAAKFHKLTKKKETYIKIDLKSRSLTDLMKWCLSIDSCRMNKYLTRAGPVLGVKGPGPGGGWTPPLTRLLSHVATRGKRHSKERQNDNETVAAIFRSGKRLGHLRSPKVKFYLLNICFYKPAHNSGTRRTTAPRKSAFHGSVNALSLRCPQIWPQVWPPGSNNSINSRFNKIVFPQ